MVSTKVACTPSCSFKTHHSRWVCRMLTVRRDQLDQCLPRDYLFHLLEKLALAGFLHAQAQIKACLFHGSMMLGEAYDRHTGAGLLQSFPGISSNLYTVSRLQSKSNPALPPNPVILQFTPSNQLRGLRENHLDFHRHNRVGGLFGLNHPADQKVFLFGHRFNRCPLGQQQFFGVQRVQLDRPQRLFGISRATASASSITAMA